MAIYKYPSSSILLVSCFEHGHVGGEIMTAVDLQCNDAKKMYTNNCTILELCRSRGTLETLLG